MAYHARAYRAPWGTDPAKQFAVLRLRDPSQDFIADTGRMLAHMFEYNPEFLLCIILLELFF